MTAQLSILNPNPKRLPGPSLLHHLVATNGNQQSVAIDYLTPDGTTQQVTYAELHRRSNKLAKRIRSVRDHSSTQSPGHHFIIPLFIPQSPDLYIAQIAILKAGAAFCPISLDVPEERLRFILQDVNAEILLTTSALVASLPVLDNVIVLAADDGFDDHEDQPTELDLDPSSPAYVMYTSGSTGQPKGVVLSHLAATQALLAHDRHIPAFSRFLQFASPTFDVSVFEIFFPLFGGRTLVCGDRRKLLSDLPGFINEMEVDAAELTPSVASSLLQGSSSVPGLTTLLTIGEMLKQDVVEDFGGSADQKAILHGMYGPTEATIHCTLQPSFDKAMSVGNIGIPLDTVSAFVVKPLETDGDTTSDPEIFPIGEEGELAVGGHQLADGYLNRPEQTKAAFIQHSKYGLLYRTGDRAKMTAAGKIECLGRISSGQVKLRGQRIELGEIEHAASKAPGCRSVVAEVVSGTLVVFLIAGTRQIKPSEVLETCRRWLPAFMVPGDLMVLESLPYLASGKVDRKALHSIYLKRVTTDATEDEPVSARLHTIIETLNAALNASVSAASQLATVGLDSLSAIRIASQLRKAGMPGLDATVLLEARTPLEIDEAVGTLERSSRSTSLGDQEASTQSELFQAVTGQEEMRPHLEEIGDIYIPTPIQAAMLSETARDSKAYCNWIELAAPKSFTAQHIEQCIFDLASHHSLLRSGFVPLNHSKHTYALVTWKELLRNQIQAVDCFNNDFTISEVKGLLRPLSVQILQSQCDTRILLFIHHALYDQWSIDVLKADLSALLHGESIVAAPSFRQLASYYHDANTSAHYETATDFWQDQMRDFAPTPLPLMTGKRSSAALQRTGWRTLNPDISLIRTAAQTIGCSVPVVFQAAMAYLLGTYVGSTDVTYGTVLSGRTIPISDVERLFGPCLATLPIRLDYADARSIRDLLRLVHDRNRAIQKHSLVPTFEIKSAANLTPDTHLFDVLFVWQETSFSSQDSLVVREVDSADQYDFNLVVEFEPQIDGLRARATFQGSLITPQQLDVFFRQIGALADAMLKDPDSLVEDLFKSLPASVMSLSNISPTPCAPGHDLIRTIEHHASTNPSKPALVFLDKVDNGQESMQTLSYQDLNERANRIAHHLLSVKQQQSDLVCICMDKSMDLYVAILATLKAGCGYLPLLPDIPPARLASVLAQSKVSICLCDSTSTQAIRDSGAVDVLDVVSTNFDSMSPENLSSTISGSDIAYTVFTSGSTGQPKGVAVTTHSLLGNLQALAELYRVKDDDRLLQACSQAFDVSVFEIFFAFYSGICLCSATRDVLFADLEASIRTLSITHLSLTPTVAALIDPSSVPQVKFLVTAGEAVTELVHERWAGKGLHQGYGPSETTNICTINMDVESDDVLGNIGLTLRNTSAMVVAPGPGLKVLPTGAVGEFAFGGEQVFKGYVGMDELNAAKIIDHPQYGRVYKSGDVGRILHDGTLLISGRLDDQVKIRGNRVELGEINAALLRSPSVHDCNTLVIGEEAAGQELVSFVLLHGALDDGSKDVEISAQDTGSIEHLFGQLEDALPSYMVPGMIVAVNRLPLTSQGKLDHRALKGLLVNLDGESRKRFSRHLDSAEEDQQWSDTERTIARVLANGLSIPASSVSPNASFFGLGLNSLNAISFAKHLSRTLKASVNPGVVLRNPTTSRLARYLGRQATPDVDEHSSKGQSLLPHDLASEISAPFIQQGEKVEEVLPCTPLQEVMISASATAESSYCNTTWLRVAGDVDRLKRCWQEMVERQAILRTRFVETQSASHPVVQVVFADSLLPLTEHEVQSIEALEEQLGEDRRGVDGSAPFSIEVYRSRHGAMLALHMHHAIYDGLSMAQLLSEVESRYREEQLSPAPSFPEFLRKTREHNSEKAMDFWSKRLNGFQPSPLPHTAVRHAPQEHAFRNLTGMPQTRVDSYCRRHGVTHLSLFQAALVKTLSHAQSIDDICIGNVVSGRSLAVDGVERLVAPCFNTIPVRVKLERMRSNLDLIRNLAQSHAASAEFQLSPLRRLQTLTQDPSKRLFDALLLLQPSVLDLDESIWRLERDVGSMGLPLVLEISPSGSDFALTVHHLDDIIPPTLAEQLSQAFFAALESCLEYPHSDVGHLEGMVDAKLHGALAPIEHANGQTACDETASIREWSPEEVAVRDVFSRFANVNNDRISKDTSMYQLGLDSLNAPQVASQLRSKGYSVDAADVMECLTPRSIARSLSHSKHIDSETSVDLEGFDRTYRDRVLKDLTLPTEDVLKVRPCTSVQSGMLAQCLQSHGELYVNHVTYEMPEAINAEQLRSAWTAVQLKHEFLRTGFYNLQSPEHPFAMLVMRPNAVRVSLIVADERSSLQQIEQQAKAHIMKAIQSAPWAITLSSKSNTLMTLSMHHALYDAESLRILLLDLQRAIGAESIGKPIDTDPLLASTISSERRMLDSSDTEAFWSTRLQDAGTVRFPDLSPTVVQESRLAVKTLGCKLDLAEIEGFCRSHNATIQALGQTAWALLLAAYTGEAGVTFGTVLSGRSSSTAWQTAFPSVATIPVPCNADGTRSEIVDNMVDYNAAVQRHRLTPLADIQRFSGHAGRSLFDTVFVYQKSASPTQDVNWPVIRETAAVDYAASLELEIDGPARVQCRLTFDTARIPSRQAQIMVGQYNNLLEDIVLGRQPDHRSAPTLFSAVKPRVPEIASEVRLMHQFVERSATHHPDRVAFEFVSGFDGSIPVTTKWTYSQLDEISNQIAHAILEAGASPGSVVALCMDKCPEATFAFVGILKAGCAFLALDPDLPHDRVKFILQDSQSSVLLTSGMNSPLTMTSDLPVLDIALKSLGRLAKIRPSVQKPAPNTTCYVLYTSGTTGTPKGCEITHESAVQAMLSFQRLFSGRWTDRSRWAQFASYWFDVSVLEQFWSWSVGISVVGAPRDLVLEDIPAFVRALNITHIDLTPSLARLVHPEEVPSLWGGVFITGGEALKQEIIDAWGSKHTICNGYGPTEATIGVTMNTFVGSDAKSSNIGRAFDNVGAYVLEPNGNMPVIRGGVGELCVSGKLVGKGYLNRPDLTSQQFPTVPELGERVYRTGDLVRLLHDDSFQFIGRQDSQAKLRGQRLELGEIDTVISQSTNNIADVLSLVVKNVHGKETLVSFLTSGEPAASREPKLDLTDDARAIVRQAQSACEQKLAGYMVPTHIIPLSRLPLTVNNKLDSKRLSKLFESLDTKDLQALKQHTEISRPLNSTGRKICEVLARLFPIEIDQTHSSSNLFSLGLSSISAISFASILKQAGFDRANVATIMKNQTVGQLAAALSDRKTQPGGDQHDVEQARLALKAHAQRHLGAAGKALNLRADEIESVTPCTPLQQGLILESLRDEAGPYFNRFEYELHDVDLDRLQQACSNLIDKVQVLRSSFVGLDEGYSQVIRKKPHVPIRRWKSSAKSLEHALLEKRRDWIQSNCSDLVTPVEIHIARSRVTDILVVNIHHAMYDAISYELMVQHLWQVYSEDIMAEIGPSFTDALPYGPLKYASGSENFWKQRMDGYAYVPLAGRYSDAASNSVVERLLNNAANLEQRRQDLGVSHQAMAQAAFEVALRRTTFTKQTQTYGVVASGRSIELEGADKVLGPMFNTLPHPVTATPARNLSQHIRHCHTMNAEALPHQHTPLRDIRKWTGMQGPLFDVLFVFQHTPGAALAANKLYTPVSSPPQAEYPLVCEVELQEDGQLSLTLLARGNYFNQADLQSLMSEIEIVFESTIADPDANLGEAFGVEGLEGSMSDSRPVNLTSQVNGVEDFEWTKEASIIRDIVAKLAGLDTKDVDEHTSVFSLGLDSIDAVKLASRLRSAGLSLPVSEILRAQTIPRMLRRLPAQNLFTDKSDTSRLVELERQLETSLAGSLPTSIDIERILPATPNQEALVADMIRSDCKEYLNHDVLHLASHTDASRLEFAWKTVIKASPVLRTSFAQVTDPKLRAVFAQVIQRKAPKSITRIQIKDIDELDDYFEEVRRDVLASLEHTPPLRLAVASIGQERYLVLSLAHALYDGHSLALLHEDVRRAYEGTFTARPSYDEAVEAASTAVAEDSLQFWTNAVSGSSPRTFPRSSEVGDSDKHHRAEIESKISAHDARSFCQRHGVSVQALAQTCWALTLAHYTQTLEVLFGVVLACRDSEEAEDILFPMMNTVVMRSSLHGSRADMLRYMQSAISEMLPHQRTPLRAIQRACSGALAETSQMNGALFDTLFIYQHWPDAPYGGREALYESIGGNSSVDYPVAVELEAVGDALAIRAACKSSVLDEQGTKKLIDTVDEVLRSIVEHPNKPTVDLKDGKASICGLDGFDVEPLETYKTVSRESDQMNEPSEVVTSPLVNEILDALAQVSEIPIDDLNATSSIESIGIDSISAIKVASLLRKKGIRLSVSDITRAKSAARMAQRVSKQSGQPTEKTESPEQIVGNAMKSVDANAVAHRAGLNADDVESILPATAGQVYMLSMWKKTRGQLFYPTFTYRLQPSTCDEHIARAWSSLVERHAVLRTIFVTSEDKSLPVLQVVTRPGSVKPSTQKQPLASLDVRHTDQGDELDLRIHHALYDAVALPLLIRDLEHLLAARDLTEPKLKQEDFIALSVTQHAKSQQRDFWSNYLQNITPIKLCQPARDGAQTKVSIFQPRMFPHIASLETLARREDLSLQALLFAAYAKIYASFPAKTGSVATDVVLGTYLSNRSHLPDLDELAAPTLNLVPLTVRSPKQRPILEVARELQRDLGEIGTAENSAAALWEVEQWTGVKVDTFVNFLKLPGRSDEEDGTGEDGVEIEEVSDGRVRERREVIEADRSAKFELPAGMEDLGVMDAYQHSLDIEMTVTEGKLDVGLFAPVEMLSLDEADVALSELSEILQGLVDKGKGTEG